MAKKRNAEAALPPGTALDTVDNPYDVGPAKIVALRSFRDDPLALMLARKQLGDQRMAKARFEAGRAWQALYRAAEVTPVQAMDPTKEPVDGGGGVVEALTDRRLAAMKRIGFLTARLGIRDERMLYHILIAGMSIREYAHATGWDTANSVKAIAWQFRQALELLAKEFGFA